MDIVVLAAALIAALLLDRRRALTITAVVWVAAVLLVAVGPAHNADVHLDDPTGFWLPWVVVGAISVALVLLVTAVRRRRAARPLER